jgi:hypothetical protein
MTDIGYTLPTRTRQLAMASLLAAAVMFGQAPSVTAAPGEWDIEAYDACMAKTVRDPATCCLISGGNIGPQPDICVAPAAAEQGAPQQGVLPGTQQPTATMTFVPMPRGPVDMPGQAAG